MQLSDPVTFKGTAQGLLVSIREDVEFSLALESLKARLGEAPFAGGGELSVDLGWRNLAEDEMSALEALLQAHGLRLLGVVSTSQATRSLAEARGHRAIIGRLGLAQHQGRAIRREVRRPAPQPPPEQAAAGEEPTLFLRRTLRSGQKVVYSGNVVVLGDVNPGAEIEAQGDVVVLGRLRGQAHAGCSGRDEATVLALAMQPTRLCIAGCAWVPESNGKRAKEAIPVRARLVQKSIKLEPALP
jgi:septum site-determining protein MinC